MRKTEMALAIAAAVPAAAFAHEEAGYIGTIARDRCGGYVLAVENCDLKLLLHGTSFRSLEGRRVEISGSLNKGRLTVRAVEELLPAQFDLVVKVNVKYSGHGELTLGYRALGPYDELRGLGSVECGDQVTYVIPVRRCDARRGVRYQFVLTAAETRYVTATWSWCAPSRKIRTAVSPIFSFSRNAWHRSGHGRVGGCQEVTLTL